MAAGGTTDESRFRTAPSGRGAIHGQCHGLTLAPFAAPLRLPGAFRGSSSSQGAGRAQCLDQPPAPGAPFVFPPAWQHLPSARRGLLQAAPAFGKGSLGPTNVWDGRSPGGGAWLSRRVGRCVQINSFALLPKKALHSSPGVREQREVSPGTAAPSSLQTAAPVVVVWGFLI